MPLVVAPDAAGIDTAVAALRAGEPVVVPTDTVYGLAVRADDRSGLDEIYRLKDRPRDLAIAVLVADADQASSFTDMGVVERHIAADLWPGALTLVLNKRAGTDVIPGRADGTVGVRCPASDFVRALAQRVGPLATTSANRSGDPTPAEALAAASTLRGVVTVVVDGGRCEGLASTVAAVATDGEVMVFREGALSAAQIAQSISQSRRRRS